MTSLTDQLCNQFAAIPAPRAKKPKQREHLERMAPIILEACYHADDISYRTLADAMSFERTNIVGTILGPGVAGRGGANLWCRSGTVLACQENCALLAPFLTAEGEAKLLSQLGATHEELMAGFRKLPRFSAEASEIEHADHPKMAASSDHTAELDPIAAYLDRDDFGDDFVNEWEGSPGLP